MLLFLNTQDLFNPQNKFSLLPAIDLVGRPIAVFGNALIGVSIKGRGSLNQECEKFPNIYLICDSQSLGLNDLRYLLSIPSFKGISMKILFCRYFHFRDSCSIHYNFEIA